MPTYLSDSEVYGGTKSGYVSDDEVLGTAPQSRSVSEIVSGGISAIADDISGGIADHKKRKRDEEIARANAAARADLEAQQRSGTSAELQAMADADANRKKYENSAANMAVSGINFGRDLGVSGAQGVVGLGESVVGLGDLATGWTGYTPGQILKDVAGYDPDATKKIMGEFKSDAGKARDAIYESTKGFTDTLLLLGTKPSLLADKIAESMAGTIAAGAVGGAVVRAALPKVTAMAEAAGLTGAAAETFIADKITKIAVAASATAEGAQQAGNLSENARQAGKDWKDYALPAVASGIGTGLISVASGGVSRKLGIGDIESDIALAGQRAAMKTAPAPMLSRAAVEGFKEGVIEEMPQATQEAAWENIAMGRPWDHGLGKAAATGLATGFGMGSGHAAVSRENDGPKGSAAPAATAPPGGGGELAASDILGTPAAPTGTAEPSESEKALFTPKSLTALDRVTEIDAKLPTATAEESSALQSERERITATWPKSAPGLPTTFTTEAGARIGAQYALMEAGDLTSSHDENLRPSPTYPPELQPRERERAASEMQVSGIVQKLDPARLGESADAATGAPIVGADGLVESGNARTIALKRAYQANGQKAADYKQFLKDNADRFGITPESVDGMQKPVLVRVRTTPVNRAEFARQANASTVAQMSPSEQARADAARIDSMEDLNPDESGDFMSGTSRSFVRRFLAKLPGTEQAGMIDATGQLSQSGYTRIRNAVLAKAYGDSPVLLRMVESLDDNTRNLSKALIRIAPQVAKVRESISEGALHDADITPDLMAAVEELSDLREKGVSIEQALAQAGMFGDKLTPEAQGLLAFLNDNIRSPRRIAEFLQAYLDALTAAGNPAQGSLLGDAVAPAKADLLTAARRTTNAEQTATAGRADAGDPAATQEGGRQSKDAPGDQAGNGRDEAARRDAAAADFKSALGDLGAITAKFANVARIVPEDTPGLMDTMVKLFDAAIRLGYHDVKKAIAYVKEQLKADPRFKTVWNKIQQVTYLKAARQAIEAAASAPADDLFSQAAKPPQSDLFAGAGKAKATDRIIIDQIEYDLDAPNFGRAKPPITLKDGDPLLVETQNKLADSLVTFEGEDMTRGEMRQELEDRYFRNAVPASADRKPIAYVMGGGGASGKGTIKKKLRKEGVIQAADAVDIDPDELKLDIPEFNALAKAGDSRGASVVHEESSTIAKRIKDRAMKGRYDIILDVTLGDPAKGMKYLQDLKDAGYEVRLFGVSVQPEAAVIRAMIRAERTRRFVPIHHLLHAHKGFVSTFERYAEIADEARLYENTTDSHNVAEKVAGKLEIKDPASYNEIRIRSKINESASTLREISGPGQRTGRDHRSDGRKDDETRGSDAAGLHRGRDDAGPGGSSQGTKQGGSRPSSASGEEGRVDENRDASPRGSQGKGPDVAPAVGDQREAEPVRDGSRRGNQRPDQHADDGTGAKTGLHEGQEPAGSGGNPEGVRGDGKRNRSRRNAGVPAGRDIPAKSGRNYSFGDGDLTYAGSWQTKARQNVEAVELLKTLQTEGRQATRDEQATLARFVGWGSSEMANNIFGDKLDKQLEALAYYDEAIANLGDRPYLTNSNYGQYQAAFKLLQAKNPALNWYTSGNITKAMLDAARPDTSARIWGKLRDRLKASMSKEEWEAASRSTQYAHYTSKPVVKAMLAAVAKMGFKGGTVLEPGAGIGVFPGLMPAEMGINSVYTGIEFDPITGGILKQLFPDERILVESFVDTRLPENFYDIAFGNPPFGGFKVLADARYAKLALSLHDYFFAKTIDSVKPGGLVVFVTSRYTMDKKDDKARAYMAERADLVGAIRLPQTAFQKNAGTEVVTDVLFLRKKVPGQTFGQAQSWAGLGDVTTEKAKASINEYFVAHPEMVLGTHSERGKMYGKNEYTVLPLEGDIETQFAAAAERLPADVFVAGRGSAAEAAKVRDMDFNPKAKKEGSFYVTDAGILMQREGGVGVRAEEKHQKNAELLKDYIGLRDAVKQSQFDQLNDGEWEASLKALQKAYATFVKKNGQIYQHTTYMQKVKVDELDDEGVPTGNKIEDEEQRRRFPMLDKIRNDPEWTLVAALEALNDDTGAITSSDWLTQRTLGKPTEADIKTPTDALLASLNDTGKVDIEAIADRMGLSDQEAIDSLGTLIYEDPAQSWVMADEYLSGNVKKKLAEAEEAAKSDKRYQRNVDALKDVQPTAKAAGDITPQIGMNWIPGEVYSRFLFELTGVKAKIEYVERTHDWVLEPISGTDSPRATSDWGVGDKANAAWLMEKALTGSSISLNKSVPDGKGGSKQVFDPDRTEAANQKRSQMREEFRKWLFQDAARTDKLVKRYNDKFNTTVQRKFDGSHLTLPGTSKLFNIFDHVKRGAWRVIQTGNTYLAHAVGSGKTFEMVISAMEQKRLGKIKKPMIIVPGHMLQQFASEWQQLYPTARLMVADEKDFHTDNRRKFASRVAMSDLDGVIMTHSSFGLLDLDAAFKQKMIEQELEFLRASYEEAGGDLDDIGNKKVRKEPKIKRIEHQIEQLEQQLAKAMSSEGKDKNVRFDEMGVDFLYVDEAHLYRKLSYATNRQMKGIDPNGSQMAWDLYMKTRWLAQKNPGRYLAFASGTPITNTTAELYTVQRFMAPQVLNEMGLSSFDDWAAQFGEEGTAIESTSSGKYEPVTRFSKFVNVGELTQMFRDFADVLNEDHLAALLGDKRPKVVGGGRKSVITPKTDSYKAFQEQDLAPRIQASKNWKPSFEQPYNPDPIIAINIDARLASIDMRFMEPTLPNDPDSKLNRMIDGVIRVYKETAGNEYKDKQGNVEALKGSTQMVFFESGFGRMAAQRRGFNARAWMEKRLRDAGIPSTQLAFMEDYKKSSAKLKLFKDVNTGKVRVLVGSSAAMGTGVNAQQRLIALHHLDAPMVPAVLEQREGRIVRQGNKNPMVQLYAYSMHGSFDENQWGMLARKKFFIEQALSGDPNIRSIEDVGEVNQLEMAAALIAENPFVIQLAGARGEVEKLTRLYRSHEEQRERMRDDFRNAERTIEMNELGLDQIEKEAAKVTDLSGDKFTAKADGKTYATRKEWGEALLAQFKALSDKLTDGNVMVGEISGFKVFFTGGMYQDKYDADLAMAIPGGMQLARDALADPVGLSLRAVNALVAMARKPTEMRRIISEAKAKRDALESRLDAPFPLAEQLANKRREAAELETQMLAYGAKKSGLEREQEIEDAWQKRTGAITPMFSRAAATLDDGISVASVEKAAQELLAGLKNAPALKVVWSPKDLPFSSPAGVRGVMHKGTIYLVAGAMAPEVAPDGGQSRPVGEIIRETVAHEMFGHYGMRGFFNTALDETFDELHEINPRVRQLAKAWVARNQDLIADVKSEYGLSDRDIHHISIDEAMAEIAQTGEKITGWKRLAARLQTLLRSIGLHKLANSLEAKTDAEALLALNKAEMFVKHGWTAKDFMPDAPYPLFMTAYHGTPHDFDRFTTDKMGTGEGAQAYGWGLYFAENKSVAAFYRNGLSYKDIVRQFRRELPDDADTDEVVELANDGTLPAPMARVIKALDADDWLGFDYPSQAITAAFRDVDQYDPSPELLAAVKEYGRLYEVELAPSEDEYLLWDKPLAEQSEKVRKALEFDVVRLGLDAADAGKFIYKQMERTDQGRSKYLHSLGIRGIKFLDGSSRSKGEGNFNYVIFDDADVSITSKFSRGTGRGMALRDLRAVVDRVSKGFKNLPRVHVLSSPSDLSTTDPTQKALRDFIKKQGAWDDVEGATHDGEIYLFASGLADEARAEHVLATHELTHYGLRGSMGKDLDAALQHVWLTNAKVRRAAHALRERNKLASNLDAIEEVLADIPNADLAKLRGWRKVVKVVRDWLNKAGATSLAARLDKWLSAGLSEQQQADLYVADLLTAARDWVKTGKGERKSPYMGGTQLADPTLADDLAEQEKWLDREATMRGYRNIDDLAEKDYKAFENLATLWRDKHPVEKAMLSRNNTGPTAAQTAHERAEAIIQKHAGTPRPIDTAIRAPMQALRLDKLTTGIFNGAAAFLDRHTPETIKAGVMSDYGIPEAVTDQRAIMQGRQKQQLRGAGALLENLSTLTRAESRVAYEWMNTDNPQSSDWFMDQLPPESVKVLAEVEKMIDDLSKEAVRLGQLSPEAYKVNRFAYLHRSYVKHTAELTKGEAGSRKRAIAVLGDQYKGRGMTDAADMAKIKNIAPEWWNRKTQQGKADKQLKGERFIRLERHAHSGEGTQAMPGIGDRSRGRLQEVAYWPAAEPIPARYGSWDQAGTWEVRDTKGGKVILWRDFSKQEREALGEIDEVRYAIAKTLHNMIHDVETGRYLEWLAQRYAKKEGEAIDGTVVEASERMRDTFKVGEWAQVPDTVIPGTKVKKYGILAGRYLPGPIWNDVRQVVGFRYAPLGDVYASIHRAWKTSKTALSPAVHMNNVMANFVMADWHDVTAGHILKALKLMVSKDAAAEEVLARFGDSGGTIGTWAAKELQQEQLRPMLEALEKELGIAGNVTGQVGVMSALQLALRGRFPSAWDAFKPSMPGKVTVKAGRALIDLYEAEDQVFRLAAWLRAKEDGATDLAAGKVARKSFLDYSINAPWVQMMRSTALPFIAFSYRAVPMMLETAAKKPWKLVKLGLLAGAINALGYMLSGGDEDDERKLLPEEKAGRVWGMTPKLLRMPWNDANGSPVFLDIRRWIPVGDVFDMGQSHAAIPLLPSMTPGGPLAVIAELALNGSQFTGKDITLATDTPLEKAAKVADHLYKAFAPNIGFLPGTHAWTGIADAGSGKTDTFGREQSLAQSVVSSVGIKVGSYPKDVLQLNAQRAAQAKMMEIDRNITALKREYQKHGLTAEEFEAKAADQMAKKRKVVEDVQKRMAGP